MNENMKMIQAATKVITDVCDSNIELIDNDGDKHYVSDVVSSILNISQGNEGAEVVLEVPDIECDWDEGTFTSNNDRNKIAFGYKSGGYISISRYRIGTPVTNESTRNKISQWISAISPVVDSLRKFEDDLGVIESVLIAFLTKSLNDNAMLQAIALYGISYRYGALIVTLRLNGDKFFKSVNAINNGTGNGLDICPEIIYATDGQVNLLFKSDDEKTFI